MFSNAYSVDWLLTDGQVPEAEPNANVYASWKRKEHLSGPDWRRGGETEV